MKSALQVPRAGILLVDDTPANLVALETILAPLDQELVLAASGRDALRALLKREFALIVMDVRMPGMDGMETADLIRQRAATEAVPIIFLTAYDQDGPEVRRAYRIGAADFVFKPVQPEILIAKVTVFVELYRKREEVKIQERRLRRLEQREAGRRLQRSESGRREAEARFAKVFEMAGDAIVVLDAEERVLLFNRGAEKAFGYSADQVAGVALAELVPSGIAPPDDGNGVRQEVRALRKDGTEFPAETTYSRMVQAGETVYTLILRDMTERIRVEEEIRRLNAGLNERLKAGIDTVADLAGSLDPNEITARVLKRVAEALKADQGILLREVDGQLIVRGAHPEDATGGLRPGSRLGGREITRAISRGQPLLNGSLTGVRGLKRSVVLPLEVRPDSHAVLVLGRREDIPFDEGDLEMLRLIGNVAVVALRNAELFIEADAASRSKSEFLNLAAHELRTPLSVVTGYLSMLADATFGRPPEPYERPIEILNAKAIELNKLVDDLLLAARLEGGPVISRMVDFDLRGAAQEAIDRAGARGGLLNATLLCELPPEPVMVRADPDHVARILDNLVNNALNYTLGRPWVRIAVTPEAAVVVEDRGAGIPKDKQQLIFERFYRGNDPDFMAHPGTGLGLYLSRQLAVELKGSLTLDRSHPSEGSVFALRLPAASRGPRARVRNRQAESVKAFA